MASHHLPPDGFNMWEWFGAIIGTVISIAYVKPKTRTEFIGRVVVSVLVGGTFGFVVGIWGGWPETARHSFAGGAAAAFFSYAAIGVVYRVLQGIDKFPTK